MIGDRMRSTETTPLPTWPLIGKTLGEILYYSRQDFYRSNQPFPSFFEKIFGH
jgi:hypothetical protein